MKVNLYNALYSGLEELKFGLNCIPSCGGFQPPAPPRPLLILIFFAFSKIKSHVIVTVASQDEVIVSQVINIGEKRDCE